MRVLPPARLAAVFALCCAPAGLAVAQAGAPTLVLIHANVIDGVSAQPRRDAAIVIRAGKIVSVDSEVPKPGWAVVIDLQGRWVLPGLIDLHVHISDLTAARTALASGVTTVRAMGVDRYADIGLRTLHRSGVADIPDVIASGYHVRPRLSDAVFLDVPDLKDILAAPDGLRGPENVRRLVRAEIARDVDVIKIMATERAGLPDTDPRKRVYTEEEMAAAVDEARQWRLTVAAHAHGDEGARAAVRAGVRTIEHGTWLADETLTLMKEKGVCFVPTIATVVDLTDPGGDYDDPALFVRGRAMLPRVRDAAGRGWKLGVKVGAGTDTGYGVRSNRLLSDEIAELVGVGMPPLDALKAATSVAAECAGIAHRTGAIRPGLEADLIVVAGDPLSDLRALREIVVVVNDGYVPINRLGAR
jgi:imidazolonepropionase-like amidohydrolase